MNYTVTKGNYESRLERFHSMCAEHGLRLTPQKKAVYSVLAKTEDHPSAQDIFQEVQKEFPSVSFATVYKNLLLFLSHKIIQELDFGEGFSRYDAHIEDHHHIYDSTHKTVVDIDALSIPLPAELQGKSVQKVQLTYFI